MSITLVTTTIYVPTVLKQYRESDPDALIIVVGDLKTPHDEVRDFCRSIRATYYGPDEQKHYRYTCMEHVPFNSIQRRNFGLLEAIRHGSDVIVTIDDDNIPTGGYLPLLARPLGGTWEGTVYQSESGWLNVGRFARESYTARGYPYQKRALLHRYAPGVKRPMIGVASSLILGDPDINATERIERAPDVNCYLQPYGGGFAISPRNTWAPINSQATAWRRDLAPLMLLPPGLGRYDDIWGSYLAQRVLMETDYHVYFGQPYVRQERNVHNLMHDLRDELYGMTYTERFVDDLKAITLSPTASILDNLATVVDGIGELDYMPPAAVSFARAWVEDMGRLL